MEITQVIYDTLEANEALDLLPLVKWEWNTRLTSTMGRYFPRNKGRKHRRSGLVEFSTVLWGRATDTERTQVVAHEICHMIQDHRYPKSETHGWEWQSLMRTAGFQPMRFHNVPVQRRAQTRVRVYCGCPGGITITKALWTRTLRNGEWSSGVNWRRKCNKCKQYIKSKPRHG